MAAATSIGCVSSTPLCWEGQCRPTRTDSVWDLFQRDLGGIYMYLAALIPYSLVIY